MTCKNFFMKSIAFTVLSCLSTYTLANELVINNKTNQPSTCKVMKRKSQYCTDRIKNRKGVTEANSENHVAENNINIACYPDVEDCLAYVYMNDHCADPVVAVVRFGISSGILSVANIANSGYFVNAPTGGFNVEITESPVISSKK